MSTLDTYEEELAAPESLVVNSLDEKHPMHSFIDYHNGFEEKNFYKMQDELRGEIENDAIHEEIKEACLDHGYATSAAVQGAGGPYLSTLSSRPMTLDPYLEYNPATDNFNIRFDIFDTEVLEHDGTHYTPDQTDNLYTKKDLRELGLSIPAEKIVSMSYEQFQATFEAGMTKFLAHCLKDETFQKRHPIIKEVVEKQKAREAFNHIKPFEKNNDDGKREFINAYYGGCMYDSLNYAEKSGLLSKEEFHTLEDYCSANEDDHLLCSRESEVITAFGISSDDIERLLDDELRIANGMPKRNDTSAESRKSDEASIRLQDLMQPETRKEAVREMTKFFLKNGMDVNQMDEVLSDVKMTALFQAVELGKENPSLGVARDGGR